MSNSGPTVDPLSKTISPGTNQAHHFSTEFRKACARWTRRWASWRRWWSPHCEAALCILLTAGLPGATFPRLKLLLLISVGDAHTGSSTDPTPPASARVEYVAKTDANAIAFIFTVVFLGRQFIHARPPPFNQGGVCSVQNLELIRSRSSAG
jgi:hypothetical protein